MLPWYATDEQLVRAFGGSDPAATAQRRRALEAGSRSIDGASSGRGLAGRKLFPHIASYRFPIPRGWGGLLTSPFTLIEASSINSGGTPLTVGQYRLDPQDGPPYTEICLEPVAYTQWPGYGDPTLQVTVGGLWGDSDATDPGGLLAAGINDTVTTFAYKTPTVWPIGTGSLINVADEWMTVTARSNVASGATLTADVDEIQSTAVLPVSSGALFAAGDTVLVDAETMLVLDVAGNTLIVQRGYGGAGGVALAAHSSGATVYAPWQLTVQRGAVGSSAASHNLGDPIGVWSVPALANALCLAEAMNIIQNEDATYGRQDGSDQSARTLSMSALQSLRNQVSEHLGAGGWIGV